MAQRRQAQRSTSARAAAAGRSSRSPRRGAPETETASWRRLTPGKVIAAIVALAAVVLLAQFCSTASSINVTVNGTQYSLRGEKTLQVALKESGLPVNPGDLISLEGNILERSAGAPFYATVNDEETDDPDFKLRDGDVVTLSDGKDTVEPYDAVESPVPFGVSILGTGPIHTFTPGQDGVMETRTGKLSGEVIDKQTVDPVDLVETRSNPNVEGKKVIALTFDNGPSEYYTPEILDILAANNAKATFFCLGESIDIYGTELVQRAAEEGHQISTHSYDDALVSGGEMDLLSPDQQLDQLERGLRAVQDAIGYEPSRCVRLGTKDLGDQSLMTLAPHIEAEIGWTLDTGDWVYMEESQIFEVLMSAKSGDVIRMHDGGGDQETTVAALKRALPKLAKRGFSFVTIDELMGKTGQEGQDGQSEQGEQTAQPAQPE